MSDRIVIEAGLCNKETFRQIAQKLERHPSTIAAGMRQNRTTVMARYSYGNDCRFARRCAEHHLCGNEECRFRCVLCHNHNCNDL